MVGGGKAAVCAQSRHGCLAWSGVLIGVSWYGVGSLAEDVVGRGG